MTCDLKMSLAVAAEKSIRPLAETVRKLTGQLAHLRQRLETERGNVGKREADLESLKAAASSYLAENTFPTFKVRLKRATENLSAARESVVLFETDLIPRTEKGLQEAHEKLAQAFTATCAAARADCEASMAEKLGAIVAEHDAFMAAIADLGKDFGTAYHGKPPVIYSPRLDEVRHTLTGRRWLTFLHAPAVAVPAAPVPAATGPAAAVPARPVSAESTATAAVGESATGGGPLPPEAAVVRQTEAADPLGARARALRLRPPVVETPQEPAPEALQAPPTDDLDTLDVDGPDLDAADADQGEVDDAPDDGDLAEVPPADG